MYQYLEGMNLKVGATIREIESLCDEAIQNHYAAVCVAPYYVSLVSTLLKGTSIETATIIGNVNGHQTTAAKSYEAIDAVQNGATEIGMYLNMSAVKNGDFDFVQEEIEEIRDSIDGKVLKVIIDVSQLTEMELVKIVQICNETFIHYIEVMNEWSDVTKEISIILSHVREVLEVKINGTVENVLSMIEKGVKRLGTENGSI